MKKISVVIACYNEEGNIEPLVNRIVEIFNIELIEFDYEVVLIDNDSTDRTREIIRNLCSQNPKVKGIFNAQNFGSIRSSTYGLLQATGDCVVKMCADFQDPPELLIDFAREWMNGYKLVLAIKRSSDENKLMYAIRKLYYEVIGKITDINHIDNFVGYGLYDRKFIEILRELNDPMPYIRGIVAELGYKYKAVYYDQPKRKSGKSKFNLYRLYDYAMLGITSYSKVPLRMATFLGGITALISFAVGIFYLIYKLVYWDSFSVGMAPIALGVFFIGAVQLLFIGILGEYILSINTRVLKRPLVIEEERINFDEDLDGTDENENK
ncbi:MAG: glycosyltransferase family 2 protein [Clostridiales bacterium]|nr:glycosyltransferase family 2 protein [Clostridiales bacterium]MCC8107023.1 glycosyltransferase family 2 protein [Clostridiales bacterium]